MNKFLNLLAVLLLFVVFPAQGASVTLGKADKTGVTAIVTADPMETGTVNVYMAATYAGTILFRGAGSMAWTAWTGGSFPVAASVVLGGMPMTVSVIDADVSSLPGLDIYVAYGISEAQLSLPGHLGRIYSVPTPPLTITTTTTVRATTTTSSSTTTTTTTTSSTTTTTLAAGSENGRLLFNEYCASCHTLEELAGSSAQQIRASIARRSSKNYLSILTDDQISAIEDYLLHPERY